MFVAIFVAAVIVSAFLDQQQRRHRIEMGIEYERLEKKIPQFPPKLQMLESFANFAVGCILLTIGSMGLLDFLDVIGQSVVSKSENVPMAMDFFAAFIAGGIALIILGIKSVAANLKYRKVLNPGDRTYHGSF